MLGFEFESKIIPFSVFNFIQSICICVAQLIEGPVMAGGDESQSPLRLYLIIVGSCAFLAQVLMLFFKQKSDIEEDDEDALGDISKYKTVK